MACIVVGLHALLLLVAAHIRHSLHYSLPDDEPFLTWVVVPPPEPLTNSSDAASAPLPSSPASRSTGSTVTHESATSVDAPDVAPRRIDWGANAAYQARKAVADGATELHRNLGPRKPGIPPEPEAPILFPREPDVFGEIGEDVNGDPIVRLSKHCYQNWKSGCRLRATTSIRASC